MVIARFAEDLHWLKFAKMPVVVYNKGPGNLEYLRKMRHVRVQWLPNVGREAHTYLHYIVQNYDYLPENVIFSQGDPMEHSPDFVSRIQHEYDVLTPLGMRHRPHWPPQHCTEQDIVYYSKGFEIRLGRIGTYNNSSYYWNMWWFAYIWALVFPGELIPENPVFAYAALFSVPRNRILGRPKSFWQWCLQEISSPPTAMNAYACEALWLYLFADNTKYPTIDRSGQPRPRYLTKYLEPLSWRRYYYPKMCL